MTSVPLPPLPIALPIEALNSQVGPEVIDLNGHMGALHYVDLFQKALPPLFRPLGFGPAYRARGLTIFQREAHIVYERELKLGDPVVIRSWLLGFDLKRFYHYHEMRKGGEGALVATIEYVSTSVSLETRRSAAFPADVIERLDKLADGFSVIERPVGAGRLLRG